MLDHWGGTWHVSGMLIFKIMTGDAWREFDATGRFSGAPVDIADGYIHFSTAEQMRETAAKHFAGQEDLHLVWGDADHLGEALKWEVSRGGAKFPHLYRDWHRGEVTGHAPLPLVGDTHVFPDIE